jgi:hypothetical protein
MDQMLFGAVVVALIVTFPLLVFAINERRHRRRQRLLGSRRKDKIQL